MMITALPLTTTATMAVTVESPVFCCTSSMVGGTGDVDGDGLSSGKGEGTDGGQGFDGRNKDAGREGGTGGGSEVGVLGGDCDRSSGGRYGGGDVPSTSGVDGGGCWLLGGLSGGGVGGAIVCTCTTWTSAGSMSSADAMFEASELEPKVLLRSAMDWACPPSSTMDISAITLPSVVSALIDELKLREAPNKVVLIVGTSSVSLLPSISSSWNEAAALVITRARTKTGR